MKKIIASAGLIALGTASLHAAWAPGLTTQETSKPFSASAALRGFYDDNYSTSHTKTGKDSFGIELAPELAYNLPLDQTYIKLAYQGSVKYYFDRMGDDWDHTHQLDALVDHRFSERFRLRLEESFVYSSEPTLLDEVGNQTTVIRTEQDGIRNRASIDFTAQITELFTTEIGYLNWYYDYFQNKGDLQSATNPNGGGSRSALLDRLQHTIHIDGLYKVRENTQALLGYAYSITDYTSSDPLAPGAVNDPTILKGTDRDNTSHTVYVGARRGFSRKMMGSIKVGAQYLEFDELDENSWAPYANLDATYYYRPQSYAQLGVTVMRAASDVAGGGVVNDVTTDRDSINVYGLVKHEITPKIIGNLFGQYQYSRFNGGSYDDVREDWFRAGVGADYLINQWWAVETRYSFDALVSDLPNRGFSRNRISLGVRATY